MLTRKQIAQRRQEADEALAGAEAERVEAAQKAAKLTRNFEEELEERRRKKAEKDKIDPDKVDVLHSRRRRRKERVAEPMPDNLKPYTAKAKNRLLKMPPTPGIMFEKDATESDPNARDSYFWTSPHDQPDQWEIQLHAAMGTRSGSSMRSFVDQLMDLCRTHWHGPEKGWMPSETELNAAISFVNSVQPRNESEAALAAQMVAVHWMTMRLSARTLQNGIIDGRSAAIAAKLARTYTMQLETLRLNRGRSKRASRQTIKVEKELHQHVHYHHHGGAGEIGGQSHGQASAGPEKFAPVSGDESSGKVVRLSGRERP